MLSAVLAGNWRVETVPSVWRERFGPSVGRSLASAFAGGVLIMFGARLAGGCTSGHIISGITQLSISSMIFAVAVFASGIGTAKLIRKGA